MDSMLIFLILNQFLWAQAPSLEGRWVQPCQNKVVREELFQGPSVALTEFYFSDGACTTPLLTFRNQGGFQADSGLIDFSFEQVFIGVYHEAIIADFNDRKVCGFNDWSAGNEKLVSGLKCEIYGPGAGIQVPPPGQKRYGIYKIIGDLLYFGRLTLEYDALSPEKRPTDFDTRYYVRQ